MSDTLDLLRVARTRYSQRQVALALGVSERTVARWEAHQTPPPMAAAALRELLRLDRLDVAGSAFTFIDLFAGIGGTRTAFERAVDDACSRANGTDGLSRPTRRTFPMSSLSTRSSATSRRWLRRISPTTMFWSEASRASRSRLQGSRRRTRSVAHGFADATQGTLFFDVARIIDEKRPAAFLLENVKNLRTHDRGRTFDVIKRTLTEQLGYELHARVINGKHFTPQNRERIMLVGFREPSDFDFDSLELEDYPQRVREILHSRRDGQR